MAAVIHNEMLDEILAQVRPLLGQGKVADYIPALASISGRAAFSGGRCTGALFNSVDLKSA